MNSYDLRLPPLNYSDSNLSDLLEGDIMLESIASSRVSVNKQIHLWPGGIVPYVFDSGLSTLTQFFLALVAGRIVFLRVRVLEALPWENSALLRSSSATRAKNPAGHAG